MDISADIARLAENARSTPKEIERLSVDVASAYSKVLSKSTSLLQTEEHSTLKTLIQAGKKHLKTLEAFRQGTASGQALVSTRAGAHILSKICDLMTDTQCIVEKSVTTDAAFDDKCKQAFSSLCSAIDSRDWQEGQIV